jgi:hypothetical protein
VQANETALTKASGGPAGARGKKPAERISRACDPSNGRQSWQSQREREGPPPAVAKSRNHRRVRWRRDYTRRRETSQSDVGQRQRPSPYVLAIDTPQCDSDNDGDLASPSPLWGGPGRGSHPVHASVTPP